MAVVTHIHVAKVFNVEMVETPVLQPSRRALIRLVIRVPDVLGAGFNETAERATH
jgi:hypothetical protein